MAARMVIQSLLAVALLATASAQAANIVYMDRNNTTPPEDAHVQAWRDVLTAAGHTMVQCYNYTDITGADAGRLSELTGADLIIIGRHTNSGDYNTTPAEIAAWHAITTPILSMVPHAIRRLHMGWFDSTTAPGAQIVCEAVIPSHPIFAGVTLVGNRVTLSNGTGSDYVDLGTRFHGAADCS